MKRYLIGLGNYSMTDDSIGLRVIEHIADNRLDQGFEPLELGQDATRVLFYCEPDTELIVVVDCVRMGCAPGEVRVFRPEEVQTTKELAHFSTHEGDLLQTLEVGRRLGYVIPPLRIVGIEPQRVEPSMDLSSALQERFAEYVELCIREVLLPASTDTGPQNPVSELALR